MPELTAETFKTITQQKHGVALVTFHASWCAPCRLQIPIIEELEETYPKDSVAIGTVDVDEEEELANELEIRTIPCTILYANGEIVEALAGFQPKDFLWAYLDHLFNMTPTASPDISSGEND